MKTCSKCKVEKELVDFCKDKSKQDGHYNQCKLCRKQYDKQHYQKNKNSIKENTKKYKELNKNMISEKDRQYRIDNAEKINQWRQTEHGRLVRKSNEHKRKTLIKYNTPVGKNWTPQDIIEKLKLQKYNCVYCKTSIKDYHEVDHFIPLCKGGSNEPSNIQLLCKDCNSSGGKGRKDAHQFAQQHGKLF